MKLNLKLACSLIFLIKVLGVVAGITYNSEANLLTVSDFPAEYPCNPSMLYATAQAHGWDVVRYDADADTYTVLSHLRLGLNNDTATYFNLGSEAAPHQTLVVHGNLIVSPFYVAGEHSVASRQMPYRVNRLTIGEQENPDIQAVLKIHADKENQHSLFVGTLPLPDGQWLRKCEGGELRVYYGTITALTQAWENAIGAPGSSRMVCFAGDVKLEHANLSWMAGFMGYGARITSLNTTYEHGGSAVVNATPRFTTFRGCTFRNLKTAVLDWGGLDMVVYDCVFKDNDANWSLTFGRGLECVDCEFSPPLKKDVYRSHKLKDKTVYPRFVSRRHLVVRATDSAGKPVAHAKVEVRDTLGELLPLVSYTDKDGVTPGKESRTSGKISPLLLNEIEIRATDDPKQQETTEYVYDMYVTAPGFEEVVMRNVRALSSWQTVECVLPQKRSQP